MILINGHIQTYNLEKELQEGDEIALFNLMTGG